MASALPRIALVDANVFFAPRMRDLFMHLHASRLLSIHWTRAIESEWSRNVIAKHGAGAADIQDCLRGMRAAAEGWEVTGHEKHISRFEGIDLKEHDEAPDAVASVAEACRRKLRAPN